MKHIGSSILLALLLLLVINQSKAQEEQRFLVDVWVNCSTIGVTASVWIEYETPLELVVYSNGEVVDTFPFDLSNTGVSGISTSVNELQPPITWAIRTENESIEEGEAIYSCTDTPLSDTRVRIESDCDTLTISSEATDTFTWLFKAKYENYHFNASTSIFVSAITFDYIYLGADIPMEWSFLTHDGLLEGTYTPECDFAPIFISADDVAIAVDLTFTPVPFEVLLGEAPTSEPTSELTSAVTPTPTITPTSTREVEPHQFVFSLDCSNELPILMMSFQITEAAEAVIYGLENQELVSLETLERNGFASEIQATEEGIPFAVSIQYADETSDSPLHSYDYYAGIPFYVGATGEFSTEVENNLPLTIILSFGMEEVTTGTLTPSCPETE